MVEIGCSRRADLDGFVKRTELSMLITGMPLSHAEKHGGMQKLLPVLTTTSNSLGTFWKASTKALISFSRNSFVGVFASLGFKRKLTGPNLASLS